MNEYLESITKINGNYKKNNFLIIFNQFCDYQLIGIYTNYKFGKINILLI